MAPDTGSSLRFLWFVLRRRPGLLASAVLSGSLWMLPTALMPLVVGDAIDRGIGGDAFGALLRGIIFVVLLGVVQTAGAAVLEWSSHTLWMHGTATTLRIAVRHLTDLGLTLTRKVRAGEVVAIGSSDVYRVGALFEVLGRASGSVVSFLVVAAVVLWVSPLLGLVVLVGVPLATAGIGPLLRPLRRREDEQRERMGEVNGLASDIVAGLRILRGVGGEARFHRRFVETSQRVRQAGVGVGRIEAWLAGAEILLPGLVTVAVTWLGARLVLTGVISVGDLIAFYGVSAFLVIPVRTTTEAADAYASALVAANRVRTVLLLRPEPAPPARPRSLPPGPLGLHDETSGLDFPAGKLTVIDAGSAAEAFAERLCGQAPPAVVLAGSTPLDQVPTAELRRRIVLVHNQDLLFSGPPRAEIDLGTGVDVDSALHAADALEVLDALPPEAVLDERGRSLSGGQRQRLVLARALCADADVLVLDEPTSAVDAHTEALIAQRVRESRTGRTTVVFSQSPLWTRVADVVLEAQPV